ncbi:hypothetical protein MF672_032175 [Actinomadura sp. ATCC 31491]|uniref:PE domain-containing protein n=1 Tax=Actinomadura luzonensis TaxID=2805427 RepID=A0ABT0G1X6_9ACTN|nr:hypothetical protein [Actinomadura luzonensis]MCK2218418.1 hypothetical protein [Actinomadura luzonensis]
MEFRRTVLHSAGTELGEVATEVRAAFDELLAAVRTDGVIPRNDDISAMIAAACAAIQEIATGSVESAVRALGGNGAGLTSMAATYEGAETDTRTVIGSLPWA